MLSRETRRAAVDQSAGRLPAHPGDVGGIAHQLGTALDRAARMTASMAPIVLADARQQDILVADLMYRTAPAILGVAAPVTPARPVVVGDMNRAAAAIGLCDRRALLVAASVLDFASAATMTLSFAVIAAAAFSAAALIAVATALISMTATMAAAMLGLNRPGQREGGHAGREQQNTHRESPCRAQLSNGQPLSWVPSPRRSPGLSALSARGSPGIGDGQAGAGDIRSESSGKRSC